MAEPAIASRVVDAGVLRIDDSGRVWRVAVRRNTSRVVRLAIPRRAESRVGGYLTVAVSIDGIRVSAKAHRLVWHCLVGPIPDGLCINHKNGVKDDNRPENLEVVTFSENNTHACRVLGHLPLGPGSKLSRETASEIRRRRAAGEPRRAVAEAFGVSETTVKNITGGYTWREVGHA